MKYDFDHWNKTEMTQEEALDWFESELEITDGKRCSPTCPQCQATEWAIKALSIKQKKGVWIKRGRIFQCSECKKFSVTEDDFCHNCGSDNREEKRWIT